MGVVTMTIDGTTVLPYVQIGSLSIDHYINNRPVMKCRLRVKDPDTYRTVVRKAVVVTNDAVTIFGGIVFSVKETDVINYKHRDLDVECVGYEVFADNVLINGIVAAGTLKSQLTTIVANMTTHGISVDPAMPSGPAMDAQGFPFFTCRQAMDQLATVSGWDWKFDFTGKVLMQDPGTVGAPFALVDTNSTILSLEHTKSLANYVNEVWVRFGDSSQQDVTDGWTGDGTTKTFALHYTAAVTPGSVIENGVTYPVGVYGVDTGYRWYYDAATTSLKVDASLAVAAPTSGHIITSSFLAQFPGAYFTRDAAEYAANGPWTIVIDYPDIFEWTQARNAADGELARRVGVVRRLRATTMTSGLEPGMTVNVTATKRGLTSVNFLIERVSIKHQTKERDGGHLFFYEIEALEGNQYQQNWIEFFRNLNRGGGSGSAGGVSSGGGSTSTTVRGAFWGGSRTNPIDVDGWQDVPNWLPIRIDGTSGTSTTVRVEQRTANSGTSVQVRIVKVVDDTVMATGATSTSTSWDEELLTFTPSTGSTDYKLQAQRGNSNARVYAIGQSL
jgi:hypothetical protein